MFPHLGSARCDILKVSVVLGLQKRITGSGDISGIMFVNITQHFSTAARQKAARMLGSFRVMVMLVAGLWFVEMADQMWRRSSPGHSLDVFPTHKQVW